MVKKSNNNNKNNKNKNNNTDNIIYIENQIKWRLAQSNLALLSVRIAREIELLEERNEILQKIYKQNVEMANELLKGNRYSKKYNKKDEEK